LNGKTQSVGIPSPQPDECPVSFRERVVTNQLVVGFRQCQQDFPVGCRQHGASWHLKTVPVDLKSKLDNNRAPKHKALRATFSHCRVSTADQSCARQAKDLRAFAKRGGYEVVKVFKETGSGTKLDRAERKKVLALAQAREIDCVLVTELSRWGRSTIDLLGTLRELESWKVSVIAMSGMTFELSTPHGRMMATFLSGIAEFERDLISERVKSGLAAAKARGKKLGRQPGQRPKSDRLAPKVVALVEEGRSYRWIARDLGISKNTVMDIVKRERDVA